MANLKRQGTFNQKREKFCGVFALTEADILATPIVATLPERTLVTNVYVSVSTASTTTGATLDVKVGATVVANEVVADATGIQSGTVAPTLFTTGGDITIVAGAVAPAAGDLVCEVIVEYVELDLLSGYYTN